MRLAMVMENLFGIGRIERLTADVAALVALRPGMMFVVLCTHDGPAKDCGVNAGRAETVSRLSVWGDGTGGSSSVAVSGGLLSLGHWSANRTMYARALPTATAKPGAYADSVVVRIDW
jgi:hypothetical protein